MQDRRTIIYLLIIIAMSLLVSLPLFLRLPKPWPDEAFYIDAARNLCTHGFLGTSLYSDLVKGLESHLYMYPPLYFLTLSFFLKIFGGSLIAARSLSQIFSISLILVTFIIVKNLTRDSKISLIAAFLAAFDILIIRGGHIARMDIETVFFNLLGILFYINALSKSEDKTPKNLFLSGVFTGLGGLSHPMGIIGFIAITGHHFITRGGLKKYFYFLIPIITLFAFWGIYIAQDWAAFNEQFLSQFKRKAGLDGADMLDVYHGVIKNAPAHFLLNLFIIPALIFIRRRPDLNSTLKSIFLLLIIADIISMFFGLFGAEMWYPLHLAPYLILSIALALDFIAKNKSPLILKSAVYFVFFGIVAYNLIYLGAFYAKYYFKQFRSGDYLLTCEALNQAIPDGSTVFMGGEPEPFFCLEKKASPPKMYQFMARGVFDVDWTNIWRTVDFFILSHSGKRRFLEKEDKQLNLFLKRYTYEYARIGTGGQGHAFIIYKRK